MPLSRRRPQLSAASNPDFPYSLITGLPRVPSGVTLGNPFNKIMATSMPEPDVKPAPEKPSLADLHWRATLRSRKRDDLDNDMVAAIETNNSWRFGMLMQVDAAWGHNERVLRAAISHGRDQMFETITTKDPGWIDHINAHSLANEAAQNGHLGFVKLFVEKHSVDIHTYSDELLRNAVGKGHEDVVGYLLSKGADAKAWSNDPIRTAAENGHLGIVKLLVAAGADINAGYYGSDVLGRAVGSGNAALVEYLLDNGADIKADKHSAFIHAAREGKKDMVQLFLDRKVDANAEDGDAFVSAVSNQKFDTAELLLNKGASIDAQHGKALRHAAWHNDRAGAEFLLNRGANPNAYDNRETPLTEAIRAGSPEMIKLLMRHGADYMALQGAAWEEIKRKRDRKVTRAFVEGAREAVVHMQDIKLAEFAGNFGKQAYTLDDLRNTKGPSGDTGLLIAAQTGKFADIVRNAKGGKLKGEDLYHPDDRIDTVFSMLLKQKKLQDFFHPGFWADRPYEVKDVISQLPEKYQKRVRLGPIANEMNYRELKKKAANTNISLKPENGGKKGLPPPPALNK